MDTTLGKVKRRLALWFSRQRIVDASGQEPRPLGLNALAFATVRVPRDLAPPVPRALFRTAFAGTPLPRDIMYQVVRRCRAEQRVTRQHAALIKLVMLSQQQIEEEEYMVELELTNTEASYQCGRLLAVLEQIQRQAIPGISATIVDRFYGTASSAPASVFSRLLRGAQPHLAKLERDKRGAYLALQSRMEQVMSSIKTFPKTLTLEGQGLFALGYYHQRAYDRAQARLAVERRKAGQTPSPEEALLDTTDGQIQKEES